MTGTVSKLFSLLLSKLTCGHCYSVGDGCEDNQLSWEVLRKCLLEEGECVSAEDLDAYLVALTGSDARSIPPNCVLDPRSFAEQILGFEDFSSSM